MKKYSHDDIDTVIKILKDDGVISVPTDTVYGICARVNSLKAFHKLVEIKNRSTNKNFPIMCSDIEQIKSIGIVDKRVEKLINSFMPGPITLVLRKKNNTFFTINNGGERETNEIAVRMATSSFLKEIIIGVGCPLFMTSANKSGMEVCKNLDDIEKMCPTLDGMVEGDVSFGKASTIVDCTDDNIVIQRPGLISEEQVMEVLNR